MTDIARARVELMLIARSLTFTDPGTSRRIELVVENHLGGDEAKEQWRDLRGCGPPAVAMVEAGID